jgi:hypothetical protein
VQTRLRDKDIHVKSNLEVLNHGTTHCLSMV